MARTNAQLLALNRGEVSKIALARIDVAKLALASQCQVNWMPLVLGPAMLRPGLLNVGEVASDNPCQLVDFVYSKTDTTLIELTANIARFWISDALLTRVAVGTTVLDPTFTGTGSHWATTGTTGGCTATVTGGVAALNATAIGGTAEIRQSLTIAGGDQGAEHALRISVLNGPVTLQVGSSAGAGDYLGPTAIDTGTHSIPFTPTGGTAVVQFTSIDPWQKTLTGCAIEGAGVVTLPTTWTAGDLSNLRWAQSGDILYFACYGQQQRKIERRGTRPGARGFSFVLYRSSNGPFHAAADIQANLTPGATTGNTTVSSDQPFFNANHVGALLRIFTAGNNSQVSLGASNAYTLPVRVSGIGSIGSDRSLAVGIAGTWSGTISFQRSLEGADGGFVDIPTSDTGWVSAPSNYTSNFNKNYVDARGTGGALTAAYDNVITWYRLGFEGGNYTSGGALAEIFYYGGGSSGTCRILSVVSPTSVNVEILDEFTNTTGSLIWQISDWCPAFGWPTSVAFAEGRLWWFSGGQIPIAGSQSNDFVGFAEEDRDSNALGDSGAILEDFGEGPSDSVTWLLSLQRLLAGREQSIASIRSSSIDTPLTPNNFIVKDCSQQGAARLPPVKVGKNGIYVQQNGNRVYELTLANPYLSDYNDRDLTRLNLDIGKPGFLDTARAMQPDCNVLLPRGDGQLACLLYDPNDEVEAWWRIMTLGVVERARVLPNFSGGSDDFIYCVVNRTINAATKRFIEKLAQRNTCVGGSINQQLDCSLSYTGAAVSTLQITWLPNTPIAVWADGVAIGTTTTDGSGNFTMPDGKTHTNVVAGLAGAIVIGSVNNPLSNNTVPAQVFAAAQGTLTVGAAYNGYPAEVFADIGGTGRPPQHIGSLTVAGGIVTLPNNQVASTIVAFLGYVAPFQSAKLAYGAQMGSALTQRKKLDHLGLVLYDTGAAALQFGQRMDQLDPLPLMEADQLVPTGTIWSEYDAPPIELPGEWDTDARLCLLAQAPNPCMVGGLVVPIQTNER